MKGTGTGVRQLNLGSYGASSSASSSSASSSQISVSDYQDVIVSSTNRSSFGRR